MASRTATAATRYVEWRISRRPLTWDQGRHHDNLTTTAPPEPTRAVAKPTSRIINVAAILKIDDAEYTGGPEWFGEFHDEPVQVVVEDAGKDTMGQGRAGLLDHRESETVRPVHISIKPTHRVTSTQHY